MSGWTRARGRTWLGIALVVALVAAYFVTSAIRDDGEDAKPKSEDPVADVEDEQRVTIVDLHPNSVPPGGTLAVRFDAAEPGEIEARIGEHVLEPVEVYADEAVFRVPAKLHGRTELHLRVGAHESPPKALEIEALNRPKIIRNVAGGLALVVLGLLSLSRAFRRRAGTNLRRHVETLTRSRRKSVTFGAAVGMLGQTSTLAAALALPTADRHVLGFRSALSVILAAHVGAVLVGALVPLAATREALLVIAAGVILRLTTSDSQGRSLAKTITGLGLLLHGAHTLRAGLAPLAEQPSWLLELRHLDVTSPGALLLTALIGALLTFAAQGPGVAFVVILSMCQATSFLDVSQGLAILIGTSLGAAASSGLISWPLGRVARRIALAHLVLAMLSTVLMWLALPWLPDLLTMILGTNPDELARGKKILRPNIGLHLVVGFVFMQATSTALAMTAITSVGRWLNPTPNELARSATANNSGPVSELILGQQRFALTAIESCLLGDAAATDKAEAHLERVRSISEREIADSELAAETWIALLAVQQSLELLQQTAKRAAERGLELEGETGAIIGRLHKLLEAGLAGALELLRGESSLDIDDLRAREIEINATEAELRSRLEAEAEADTGAAITPEVLLIAELANSYEGVGNQVYRLSLGFLPEEF